METLYQLDSFVYDASIDRYRFITLNTVGFWPSWSYYSSIIHPETGVEESRTLLGTAFAVAHAWTDPMYNGGLNKLYAGYLVPTYRIVEVLLPDGIPTATMISNPFVTTTQIPSLSVTNYGFALCPERKLVTILSASEGLVVYDYSASPAAATKKYWHPFHELYGWSVGYESDERCWLLYAGAIFGASNDGRQTLVKYNFLYNRFELISELQPNAISDRMAKVAWDTKRKKLGVLRVKADDADGAPNNAFEVYAPRPAITQVTVPVNVDRLSQNRLVPFVAHVLGSKGEAGGLREVDVSAAPTTTLVTQPKQLTKNNGSVTIEITPPTAGAAEALTVSYNETKVLS